MTLSHLAVDVLPDVIWIVVDFKDLLFQLFYVIIICVYFVSVCMYGCTAAYLGQDTLEKEIFNLNEFIPG